ncbi:MAG: TolC family protein [Planctomycetota bacterium]|jgi:cobalt-zinc-cadmium efflux system outer membrane protein
MRLVLAGAAACLIAVGGCGPGPLDEDYWPAASPLGHDIKAVRVPSEPPSDPEAAPDFTEPTGDLALPDALSMALVHGPELAAFAWQIRAEEAAVIQAGLLPNPEIELELEDFGGTGGLAGFGGSETTLAIGQTILLGGKLRKRVELSRLGRDLAGWDYEVARVEALTRTAVDFVNTLAAQQRLTLTRDTEALAERIFLAIGERVEAGKISPVERTKARVEFAQARLDRLRAERELEAARYRLAANWGSITPRFALAVGDLAEVRTPPGAQRIIERIEHNPDLARWATEMATRRAAIELARAEAVPDITLMGGPKMVEGANDMGFVAGFSIPIPLFDRNQGGILDARIRLAKAERLRHAAEVRVRTDLVSSYQSLDAAYIEVETVRDEVEPGARSAFEAAEEAFRQGKIGALDLLDAQRTLFGVREQYVAVLAAYHQATIDVERLIGAPLHEATQPEEGGAS